MIAFQRTHTSKRSILSLHSKNMWSTNVDGTLVRETLRPRDTPERALRELWHTSALSVSVYLFLDKLHFWWNLMGSEFMATSEGENRQGALAGIYKHLHRDH